jgi:hypothetical protein
MRGVLKASHSIRLGKWFLAATVLISFSPTSVLGKIGRAPDQMNKKPKMTLKEFVICILISFILAAVIIWYEETHPRHTRPKRSESYQKYLSERGFTNVTRQPITP